MKIDKTKAQNKSTTTEKNKTIEIETNRKKRMEIEEIRTMDRT